MVRAYGGSEAIALAQRLRPDLILLDLMMPDVSGFDVVEALQRDADTARIPILVVTAKQITAEDRAALNSNAGQIIHIVEKAGFNRVGFIAEVRRALGARTSEESPMARILIIEDNPANMKLASLLLRNAGHTALCAVDAETGLTLARAEQPDLILMDIQLPGMDGLAATALLKKDPATAAIPVIALTAMARKATRKKARWPAATRISPSRCATRNCMRRSTPSWRGRALSPASPFRARGCICIDRAGSVRNTVSR